jgi:hypothetical protein
MAGQILSIADIARQFQGLQGFIGDIRDWAPSIKCSSRVLPAAVIAQTVFFDTPRNIPHDNLERQREFPYRTIIMGYAYQFIYDDVNDAAPLIADALILFEEGEFELTVDNLRFPSWPACALPGGGGINAVSAPVAGGAATDNVSNGLSENHFRMLMQPIAVDIHQNFDVTLRSLRATALSQPTKVRFMLSVLEARRVL